MTASGVLYYTTPYTSARTELGEDASPAAIGSLSAYTTTAHPNTGNLIEGWKWDERVWAADGFENDAIQIPRVWDPTTSGVPTSYFQSGIGSNDDLQLLSLVHVPSSGLNRPGVHNVWAPEVNHGYYYDFNEESYLFSDDSHIQYVSYSGVVEGLGIQDVADSYNTVTLSGITKVSIPIQVTQYQWDDSLGKHTIYSSLRKKVYFTGIRDSDLVRQSTWDTNKEVIIWDNIDQSEGEFVVTYSGTQPQLICNNQFVEAVGSGVVPSGLEFLGYADGTAGQQFQTEFAPIDSTMGVSVYSWVTAASTQEWEVVSSDTTLSGYQVKLDYDLGILEFGDPTTVSGQLLPLAGESVGISYWKTYRVEYELEDDDDTIIATEASTNPVYRTSAQGFVYLSTSLEDPASITLRADLPETQTNYFGPLYIGNAYAPIIATVKDANGNVLEGQTVNFFITSEPVAGGFGAATSTTGSTDQYGEATVFYNPPRGINDLGENITASGYSVEDNPTDAPFSGLGQITTLHTENLFIEAETTDIFLYEVHVDDALLGFLNTELDHDSIDIQLAEYYRQFFQAESIWGPTGLDTVTQSGTDSSIAWEADHRTAWTLPHPRIFQSNAGMGRKKLVAVQDSVFLDPHDFTAGAVGPVQPIAAIGTGDGEFDVVFDTSSFSIPEPTGTAVVPSGTLHSYFLVSPTVVKMQASVYNARRNQTLFSNTITVKLRIPDYLSGLWILDAINQNHIDEISSLLSTITASGQKVPLGFRLRSSTVTLAGALDGVTFLDVNPEFNYDPYDPSTVSGVSLGFQVRVFPIT